MVLVLCLGLLRLQGVCVAQSAALTPQVAVEYVTHLFTPNPDVKVAATGRPLGAGGSWTVKPVDATATTIAACQVAGASCLLVRYSVPEAGVVCSWTVGRVAGAATAGTTVPTSLQPRILEIDENAALYTLRKDWVPGEPQIRATRQPLPEYPRIAQAAHVEGRTAVVVTVGATGEVKAVLVTEAAPMLRAAVERAAKDWQFAPLVVGSRSVAFRTKLVFDFRWPGGAQGVSSPEFAPDK